MSGYSFDKLKMVVVADNQHLRKLVATILHAFGVTQVQEADDHHVAWKILCDVSPDIALVDWQGDAMPGLELVKRIRNSGQSPNPFMPIILLTGRSDSEQLRLARDAGVNEYLAKPVSPRALMSRLVSVIEHPRPFVRTNSFFGPCRRYRASDENRGPDRRLPATVEQKKELAAA